jgi:choline kinase
MNTDLRAIILAAGRGSRLMPLTKDVPKCLLDIGGRSILEHQLENIQLAGIKEVSIVVGAFVEKIEEKLKRTRFDLNIELIYNPFHEITNNLVSLWFARHKMNGDFILMNGDVIFHPDILLNLIHTTHNKKICLSIAKKAHYDEDDMKVQLDGDKVLQVRKSLDPASTNAESLGMLKFIKEGASNVAQTLELLVRDENNSKAWFLIAIEKLISQGQDVNSIDMGNLPWIEIDYPQDLEKARSSVINQIKKNSLRRV